jgi:transitional endoplasmic reticulum ATPase
MAKELKLKVVEAVPDDVEKGIVRIDSNFMKDIGVKTGDIVEIKGERSTVAVADRAYPGDIGLNIIRMDGILRKNAKTGIGELVNVKKAEVKEAKKIVIAPSRKGVIVKASAAAFKQGLLGRAVIKGDIISLGGARTRKTAMADNPFFDDVFKGILEENFSLGFGFGDLKFIVVETNPKEPVIITESTEITLNPEAVELKEEVLSDVNYEDIGGLDEEIKKIREMVELPLKHPELFEKLGIEPPKGVLLHGPPGTGKTLLAKAVANESDAHFSVINGPEIMSKFYGESEANIRKFFEEAEKNAPSIIFIDEIDSLAPKREESKGEVERRVVAQLLALMDGLKSRGKVVVIAATNIPNALDPALRRPGRFDREISINVPDKKGRLIILKIHTRNMPLAKEVNLDEIAEITYGFVGADLAALAKEAAMVLLRKILPDLKLKESESSIPPEIIEKLIITQNEFKEALKVVRPSAMREVLIEKPNVKWADIGGLEGVKQRLKEAVEWPLKNPKDFKRMGVNPPRGILLYGAPGTGKTLLAKAVATESKANFILVKGPELLSKWVGESEKAVREIFKKARQTAPTIVFFDEIDALAPKRGTNQGSHVTESVVNQILTEIDGLESLNDVVVLGATNRPDIVDSALLRPGRFDRLILTPIPDKDTREKILEVHTKNMPLKDVDLKKLVEKTEGYTGSDMEALAREAAINALRKDMSAKEITMVNFEEAMKEVGPSVTKEVEKKYAELNETLRSATAKQMEEESPSYFG